MQDVQTITGIISAGLNSFQLWNLQNLSKYIKALQNRIAGEDCERLQAF